jgi:hypothetical protein
MTYYGTEILKLALKYSSEVVEKSTRECVACMGSIYRQKSKKKPTTTGTMLPSINMRIALSLQSLKHRMFRFLPQKKESAADPFLRESDGNFRLRS